MTLEGVLSDFQGFTAQKKIKRAILPDFSTFFHFFHAQFYFLTKCPTCFRFSYTVRHRKIAKLA